MSTINTRDQVQAGQRPDRLIDSIKLVYTDSQQWLGDTCELVMAESRLACASLTTMLTLGLVAAMTLFLAFLALTAMITLTLAELLPLTPFHLAMVACLAFFAITAALAYIIVKLSRFLLMQASIEHLTGRKHGGDGSDVHTAAHPANPRAQTQTPVDNSADQPTTPSKPE